MSSIPSTSRFNPELHCFEIRIGSSLPIPRHQTLREFSKPLDTPADISAANDHASHDFSDAPWLAIFFSYIFVFAVFVALTLAFLQMALVITNEFNAIELHDYLAAFRG